MKLPSLNILWQGLARVALRFPLQFLLTILATGTWWYLIGHEDDQLLENTIFRLLISFNLALTLLLAADLFTEAKAYSNAKKWLLRMVALAICTGLYLLLDPFANLVDGFRMALFAFAFHLLVAIAPFIGKGNINGFWQYNKTLFLRFLSSAFYAAVLYAGLAIAVMAINGLFNVTIDYQIYLRLLVLVGIGFTTLFFLAGVPADFIPLEEEQTYPKGLKIFTQYVLIPLMTIYLAILLVYEVKIIINWELPKGLVSTLILGYAIFGILSLLLIYPIKDKEGNGWIKLFSRFFYLMMIPLVVLLMLAIGKRVGHYGITESRYILMVLALWLGGITVYFLFSKKQNIKLIPISLCIIALLATYGPQSASAIAKNSQVARLKKIRSSKVKKEKEEEPFVIRYLVERHGLSSLQAFTEKDLKVIEQKITTRGQKAKMGNYYVKEVKIDSAFAILKVKDNYANYAEKSIGFLNSNRGVVLVKGYDAVFAFRDYELDSVKYFDGSAFKFDLKQFPGQKRNLKITINKQAPIVFDVEKLALQAYHQYQAGKLSLAKENYNTYLLPQEQLSLQHLDQKYSLQIVISTLNGNYDVNEKRFSYLNFEGYLLIKKNE